MPYLFINSAIILFHFFVNALNIVDHIVNWFATLVNNYQIIIFNFWNIIKVEAVYCDHIRTGTKW